MDDVIEDTEEDAVDAAEFRADCDDDPDEELPA